jgi:pimeloyl-ACP methyl ester carboxylesterase
LQPTSSSDSTPKPITLATIGSFFIGGQRIVTEGAAAQDHILTANGVPVRIDPNGTNAVGHMYVQSFIQARAAWQPPLAFWHGGSMTGAVWETTPDGREGWLSHFLRQGWSAYNVDAVERGRAGWTPGHPHFAAPPILRTLEDSFAQFRLGTRPAGTGAQALAAAAYPGCQFPLDAFDAFVKQVVPRWSATDALILAAYLDLLDRVGPVVVIAHSQGGAFALRAAEARPDKVAALVAIEPAQGGTAEGLARRALAGTPILLVYGDHLDRDARWPTIRARSDAYFDALRAAGGNVTVLDLPKIGLYGNSHLLMMELNNLAIAERIQHWLEAQTLG